MHMYLNTMAIISDKNIGRRDALGFFLDKTNIKYATYLVA